MAGMKVEQSTELMIANFMDYHEKGYNIPEIAAVYGVHTSTIYRHLGEIAEQNGVTRESLLQRVCYGGFEQMRQAALKERVDCERLLVDIRGLEEALERVVQKVHDIIISEEEAVIK